MQKTILGRIAITSLLLGTLANTATAIPATKPVTENSKPTTNMENAVVVEEQITNPAVATLATANHMITLVDGKKVDIPAYTIDGYNYVKVRDLAYTLQHSKRAFAVSWDDTTKVVALTSGEAYRTVGGEMVHDDAQTANYQPSDAVISINGTTLPLTAYLIEGNNYVKLRDLGQAFDFGVDWNAKQSWVVIETDLPYMK